MDKGKAPMDPHTPNQANNAPRFDPETAWREVSNNDIWKIRDGESIRDYRERMIMVRTKVNRICFDLQMDLDRITQLSESRRVEGVNPRESNGINSQIRLIGGEGHEGVEEEDPEEEEEDPEEEEEEEEEECKDEAEPMEEGELHVKEESDTIMEHVEDGYLSDPPVIDLRSQLGSVYEMQNPKQEPLSPIGNLSEDEREDWGSHYDLYGFRIESEREFSSEEEPEEEEEMLVSSPTDSDWESEGGYSSSSSDSGDDGDDEDFDISNYNESADFMDALY